VSAICQWQIETDSVRILFSGSGEEGAIYRPGGSWVLVRKSIAIMKNRET